MNKCPNCGAEFEGKFCPSCGAEWQSEKSCPQCGATLHGSARFCNHCGHSFVAKPKKKSAGKAIKNFAQKSKAWIIAHKTLAIVVAAVILLGILLAVILPLTVGNIFRANRIAKINIGDDYAKVEKVLGKPYESKSSQYEYNYYGDNVLKKLKELDRLEKQMDKIEDFDDLEKFADKEDKLKAEIEELEYKHISVTFSDGKVSKVQYDTHAKQKGETPTKWNKSGGGKQKIVFVPNEIIYGLTPQDSELYAKIYYADGSYRLSRVYPKKVEGDKEKGWTLSWSDDWGEYSGVIKSGTTVTKESIIKGYVGECAFRLYPIFNGDDFSGSYRMELTGDGEIAEQETYPWTELRNKITELVIGEGVLNVPNSAFSFSALEKVTLSDSVTAIGDKAFDYCESLTSINLPENLTSIGEEAFHCCESLTSITIPAKLTSIGNRAFVACSKLSTVYWNAIDCTTTADGTGLSYSIFEYCYELTTVVIGDGVKTIPNNAFAYCTHLTTVTIPDSVTYIGYDVFWGCALTTVTIPVNLTALQDSAFRGCANLETVYWNATNCEYARFPDTVSSVTFGNNVQNIPSHMFSNCSNLTSVTIPASVTGIGAYAFAECTALTSVTFASNSQLKSIGRGAFSSCAALTSVAIPDGVTTIEQETFSRCEALASVTLPDGLTQIDYKAFYKCESLMSLTIPASVIRIYSAAFDGCKSLKSVTFAENSQLEYLSGFGGCSSLTSVTIPASVTTIDSGAFYGCSALTTLTIPEGLTSIGSSAFSNCANLSTVEWNATNCKSVYYVVSSRGMFVDCPKLTSVTFGDNVQTIPDYLLYECKAISSVTIPASVTSIGAYAFAKCTALTSVNFAISNGWTYSRYATSTSGTNINGLSNPQTAAQYLTNTYSEVYWKRS